ncbi:DUF4832 domain-containing protein [Paenibacillus silviterrae]|uniref:DUF4832 domain-containing protein n=1 Tax=Paenibacillus silviterrae TaxID=3242194 RepID=UPI002542928B|nr:DUF4832 domain-containing protein [Paenibacillus chinjuensis]
MKFRSLFAALSMLIMVCIGVLLSLGYSHAKETSKKITYIPSETDQVLTNPYMGFSIDATNVKSEQPVRMVHANLSWRELEPEKGFFQFDSIEKKFNFSFWKSKDVKIVLRVVLDYPSSRSHMDIPDWLYSEMGEKGHWYDNDYGKGFSPDYANPVLIENHERLMKELGQRYNKSPQIAFIQLGSIGHWGEWHTWDDEAIYIPFPKHEITDQYALHYVKYFPDKKLLMRRPHQVALDHQMGLFNDAFGKTVSTLSGFMKWYTEGYTSWLTKETEPAMPDFWTKAPSGGEFSHPTKYFEDEQIEETIRQARLTHVTWMGPSSPFQAKKDGPLQANIDRFLKTVGYRFVITRETHEKQVSAGGVLNVQLSVTNRGVAPFYYKWPVELSLSDDKGNIVYQKAAAADIREWLPGEHQFLEALRLPDDLPAGKYRVNVAILDPERGIPGIEFANDGRRADGRYALGQVSVYSR